MIRSLTFALLGMSAILIAIWARPDTTNAQNLPLPQSGEPVLVELFTSQGCSSCPPADRLAAELADNPRLVIISRPVDYWDRLGWRDTLATPENTALQRAYARRGLTGYNGVYTPQNVVNGRRGDVGSNRGALIMQVRAETGKHRAAIRINRVDGQGFAIGLAGETPRRAELVLAGVASSPSVAIGRGENRGREITYTNVLRGERRIASWSGGSASHAVRPSDLTIAGADRYALILRLPAGGEVLAARWLD